MAVLTKSTPPLPDHEELPIGRSAAEPFRVDNHRSVSLVVAIVILNNGMRFASVALGMKTSPIQMVDHPIRHTLRTVFQHCAPHADAALAGLVHPQKRRVALQAAVH